MGDTSGTPNVNSSLTRSILEDVDYNITTDRLNLRIKMFMEIIYVYALLNYLVNGLL